MKKLILFLIFSIGFGAINTSAQTSVTTFQGETLRKAGGIDQQGNILIESNLSDQTTAIVTRSLVNNTYQDNLSILNTQGEKVQTISFPVRQGSYGFGSLELISYTDYDTLLFGNINYDDNSSTYALYSWGNNEFQDSILFYNSTIDNLASSSSRIYSTVRILDNESVVGGTGTYGKIGTTIVPYISTGPQEQESLLAVNHNGFTIESPIYLEKAGCATRTLDLIPVNGDGVVLLKSLYAPNVGGSNDTLNEYVFVHFNENLVQTDTLALQYADLDDEPVMYYDTLSSTYYLAIREITGDAIIYRLDSNWNTIDSANLGSQYISKMEVIGEQLILDGHTWMSKSLKGGWERNSANLGYAIILSDSTSAHFGSITKPLTAPLNLADRILPIGFRGTYYVHRIIESPESRLLINQGILGIKNNAVLGSNGELIFDSAFRSAVLEVPFGFYDTFTLKPFILEVDQPNGEIKILGRRIDEWGNVIWRIAYSPTQISQFILFSPYQIEIDLYLYETCSPLNPPLTASRQDKQLVTNLAADSLVWYFNNTPIADSDTAVWSTSQAGWYFAQSFGADGTARCVSDSIYFEPCLPLDVSIINNGGTLSLDTTGEAYEWYDANNKQINGAYKSTYTPITVGQYKSRIYHDTGCYSETSFYELTSTASVADYVQDNYTPYPNPTTNQLHIPRGEMYMSITLTNTIGSVVHESDGSPIISTKNLPAGSYTLKCVSTGGERTYKIMIVR